MWALPVSVCKFGYPRTQADDVLRLAAPERAPGLGQEFWAWIDENGTAETCQGVIFHPETDPPSTTPSGCGPHGLIVAGSLISEFLSQENQT